MIFHILYLQSISKSSYSHVWLPGGMSPLYGDDLYVFIECLYGNDIIKAIFLF